MGRREREKGRMCWRWGGRRGRGWRLGSCMVSFSHFRFFERVSLFSSILLFASLLYPLLSQNSRTPSLSPLPSPSLPPSLSLLFFPPFPPPTGMCDTLTNATAATFSSRGAPLVFKYLPYGALSEVMPYLGRRAIENKAVLKGEGGAKEETERCKKELMRRWLGYGHYD